MKDRRKTDDVGEVDVVQCVRLASVKLVYATGIKKAYLKAVRLVHPDKQTANAGVRRRVLAQKLFARLNEAHSKRQSRK